MNVEKIKIEQGVIDRGSFWTSCPPDSENEKLGFLRWHELLEEIRRNPEVLGSGEVIVAIGTPVRLFGHVGYRFVYRPDGDEGSIKMSSDPFEKPITEFSVYSLYSKGEKTPNYGTLL